MKDLSVLDCCPVADHIAELQTLAVWKQGHEGLEYFIDRFNVGMRIQRLIYQLRQYRLFSRDFRCY